MNEWISVQDRLPESDHFVLAWTDQKYPIMAIFRKYWFIEANTSLSQVIVTHWQELPPPPIGHQ